MTDLGSYVRHNGRPAVRFERDYPYPVERVWAAVTDPVELSHWFPSTLRFEPRVGGVVRFTDDSFAEDADGTVLVFDPPRRFSFSWLTDEVHLELAEDGEGSCRLTLINVLADRSAAARNAGGWYVCLSELAKLLDGQPSGGPHSQDAQPWQPIYEAHVRAGLPGGAQIPQAVIR